MCSLPCMLYSSPYKFKKPFLIRSGLQLPSPSSTIFLNHVIDQFVYALVCFFGVAPTSFTGIKFTVELEKKKIFGNMAPSLHLFLSHCSFILKVFKFFHNFPHLFSIHPLVSTPLSCRTIFMPFGRPSGRTIF